MVYTNLLIWPQLSFIAFSSWNSAFVKNVFSLYRLNNFYTFSKPTFKVVTENGDLREAHLKYRY